jgi:hypothetical protein
MPDISKKLTDVSNNLIIIVSIVFILVISSLSISIYNTFNSTTASEIENNTTVHANTLKIGSYPGVKVATVEYIDLTINTPSEIDGVRIFDGDLVLVQFNNIDNGIYESTDGVLIRSDLLQDSQQVNEGGIIYVAYGNVYGNSNRQLKLVLNKTDNSTVEQLSFVDMNLSILPEVIDTKNTNVLTSVNNIVEWSSSVPVMDDDFTDTTLLYRTGENTITNTEITVTNGNELKHVKCLSYENDTGNSVSIEPDELLENNVTLVLPNTVPQEGLALIVDSVDLINNRFGLNWGSPPLPEIAELIIVNKSPQIGQYSTITAALASITDSSANKPYIVQVYAGIYSEDLLVIPDYTHLVGLNAESCEIHGGNNTIIICGKYVSVTNFTIESTQIVGSGFFGIDSEDGVSIHIDNVAINKCDGGIKVSSIALDTNIVLSNVFCSDLISRGLEINAINSFKLDCLVESSQFKFSNIGTPCGFLSNGADSKVVMQSCSFHGLLGTGEGIVVKDGSYAEIMGVQISDFTEGIKVPVNGTPTLYVTGCLFINCDLNINVLNTSCIGYVGQIMAVNKIYINETCPFEHILSDDNIITVRNKGGDFTTIEAAINYINSLDNVPSALNVYLINVGLGLFLENDLTIPSYVNIRGETTFGTIIQQISSGTTFITVQETVTIEICSISLGTSGSTGILYNGSEVNGFGLIMQRVAFVSHDPSTLVMNINTDLSSTSISNVVLNLATFVGPFSTGILLNNTVGNQIVLTLQAVAYNNTTVLTSESIFLEAKGNEGTDLLGSDTIKILSDNVTITDSNEITEDHLIAYKCSSFVNLNISNGKLENLKESINLSGAVSQQLDVIATEFLYNNIGLSPLIVSNISTTGFVSAQLDVSNVTCASELIKMFLTGMDGIVFNGDILAGDALDTITNISTSVYASSNVGVASGGDISYPVQPDLTNFVIAAGSGYLVNNNNIQYLSWLEKTITLSVSVIVYLYIDVNGDLISNQTTLPTSTTSYILIGRVYTDATKIVYFQDLRVDINQQATNANFQRELLFGNLFSSGAIATLSGVDEIDVTSGTYYYGINKYTVTGGISITFTPLYNDGSEILADTQNINLTQYDNVGTLTAIPAGEFVRHALYVIGGDFERYLFVFATSSNAVANDAELAPIPTFFGNNIAIISSIVVEQGVGIDSINDIRNSATQQNQSTSTPTDHQLLTNRTDDLAHAQYYLKGGDIMSGILNMGAQALTNATTFTDQSGVPITLSTISTRLIPGGIDALPTAAPESVGIVNSIGAAASFSRSNHIHAHGIHSGATDHAAVTTVNNGFMLATDKVLLDAATSIPTDSTLATFDANSNLNCDNLICKNEIRMANSIGNFYTTLSSHSTITSDLNFILPSVDGSNGEFLQTNGAGQLVFAAPTISSTNLFQVSTSSTINLDQTIATKIVWNSGPTFTSSAFTLQGANQNVLINNAGRYKIYFILSATIDNTNINLQYNIEVNNSIQGSCYAPWINPSRVDIASASMELIFDLEINDTVSISSQTYNSVNGNAILVADKSIFSITEI